MFSSHKVSLLNILWFELIDKLVLRFFLSWGKWALLLQCFCTCTVPLLFIDNDTSYIFLNNIIKVNIICITYHCLFLICSGSLFLRLIIHIQSTEGLNFNARNLHETVGVSLVNYFLCVTITLMSIKFVHNTIKNSFIFCHLYVS